jgi:hypothetical protein
MNSYTERERKKGLGVTIPPQKFHVILYFSQQGQTEQSANEFFQKYSQEKWKNNKGKRIKNWKVHAWQWIWQK